MRHQESLRLDRPAEKVTADTDRPLEDRARRLAAVERLRGLLINDPS